MLDFREYGDDLRCCSRISVALVPELATMGFRSLICNRPDGEPDGVPFADIERAARRHGLAFAYQPVLLSRIGPADGGTFGHLLYALPKPILAYCRSGRRSAALWVLARAPRIGAAAALAASRASGCDLDDELHGLLA
jgi:sulfide:quinone oxidoreductase